MDPCRRIWFYTPLQYLARCLGIAAGFILIVITLILF